MKVSREKYPAIAKAWDDYGHSIAFEDLFDMKMGDHPYVVLAWMEGDLVNYADLASSDGEKSWEFQNDGADPIPLSLWKKLKVAPGCDWMEGYPDE